MTATQFSTVADMVAATGLQPGELVQTLGYNSPGDGGGTLFQVQSPSTEPTDSGEYIDLTGSTGQAEALFSDPIYVEQFGAFGDGVGDDTVAFQRAFTYLSKRGGGLKLRRSYLVSDILTKNPSTGAPLTFGGRSFHVSGLGKFVTMIVPSGEIAPAGSVSPSNEIADNFLIDLGGPTNTNRSPGFVIEGFTIYNSQEKMVANVGGLRLKNTDKGRVTDVMVMGLNGVGVELYNIWDSDIHGLEVQNCGSNGFTKTDADGETVDVAGVYVFGTSNNIRFYGLRVERFNGITNSGNLGVLFRNVNNMRLFGMKYHGKPGYNKRGMDLIGVSQMDFFGPNFTLSSGNNIALLRVADGPAPEPSPSNGIRVYGGNFSSFASSAGDGRGIELLGSTTDVEIQGTRFLPNPNWTYEGVPIYVAASAQAPLMTSVTNNTGVSLPWQRRMRVDLDRNTYIPEFGSLDNPPIYVSRAGKFQNIGSMVMVSLFIEYNTLDTTDTSPILISIPFAADDNYTLIASADASGSAFDIGPKATEPHDNERIYWRMNPNTQNLNYVRMCDELGNDYRYNSTILKQAGRLELTLMYFAAT